MGVSAARFRQTPADRAPQARAVALAGGKIVATFDGAVVNVAFRKHEQTETQAAWVERIHKIKLGETQ